MDEAEVRRKYDAIVDFAELGDHIDLPFKTYSLGMQARLCFSVAISVEPEILIIDEALAAGDSAFIAKCFERIREICASGATVLFVSHNTYLVQRLCGRALWIDSGHLVGDGDPALVCRDYEATQRQQEQARRAANASAERRRFSDVDGGGGPAVTATGRSLVWGTGEVRFTDVALLAADGLPARTVYAGDRLTIRLRYEGEAPYDDLAVVVQIVRADGVVACGLDAREDGLRLAGLHGAGTFEVTLDPLLLGRGRYFVSPHVYRDRSGVVANDDVLVFHDRLYEFEVERRGRPYDVAVEQPVRWRHTTERPGAAAVPSFPGAGEATRARA
jgi:lipopolysaccharide transport system ATP-binding protein